MPSNPTPLAALLAAVDDVLDWAPSPRQRNELRDAAFAVRAQLAETMSDEELRVLYVSGYAIPRGASRHVGGLRAVERAVRERMGLPPE